MFYKFLQFLYYRIEKVGTYADVSVQRALLILLLDDMGQLVANEAQARCIVRHVLRGIGNISLCLERLLRLLLPLTRETQAQKKLEKSSI